MYTRPKRNKKKKNDENDEHAEDDRCHPCLSHVVQRSRATLLIHVNILYISHNNIII